MDRPRRPKLVLRGETPDERKVREARQKPMIEQMLKDALDG